MLRKLHIAGFATAVMISLGTAAAQNQLPELTNLQYFPKTTSREELVGIMRGFSFSLGVRSQYCHAGTDGPDLKDMNFASDDKETKRTARVMLRMVDAINQQYIAKVGTNQPARVECVTCHHRLSKPITMNALLAETLAKKDLTAAINLYRELREKTLGGGQYDFGETPLNQLTESLLKEQKTKEAAAIMELNVQVNTPPSLWSYSLLAMAHVANKETEKAKADYRKILEMNPQNVFAKKQLDQLNAQKE